MAKYRVTAPDGNTYEVVGPEGASDEEIAYVLHSNLNPTALAEEEILPQPTQKPVEDNSSDFIRGFKNYIPQTKQIIGGAQVLAGKAFDQPGLIESGAQRMKAAEGEIKTKATDSFVDAWEKGGVGAVATDWLPYQAGAGAANILEVLAASGAGAMLGSVIGPGGTAGGALAGAVEKELVKKGVMKAAEKILDKEAKKVFIDQEARIAAKEINKKIGRNVGISIDAMMHGSGEVTQRAVQEAQNNGMSAEDIDLGVVLPAAIGHSITDFVADKIGLAGLSGKLTTGGKSLVADIAKNIAVTGTLEIPPELAQSMFERYGAGLSVTEKEALREYIDTAAAAFGMAAIPGGVGGVSAHYTGKQTPPPTPETETTEDQTTEETTTETPTEETKAGKIKTSKQSKGPSIAEILAAEEDIDEKSDTTKSGASVQVSGQLTDGPTKRARRIDGARVVSSGANIPATEDRTATKLDTLTPEVLLEKLKTSEDPIKNTAQVRNFLKSALPTGGLAQLELDNPAIVKDLFDQYKSAPELKTLKERNIKLEEANKQAQLKQEEELSKEQFNALHPYLRTVSRYAKEAPVTKERGLDTLAAEEAFNDYDLMDVKGYKKELSTIAKQKTDEALAERKANLDNLIESEKLTKRQAENKLGTAKDFTFSSDRPYDYLTPDEILAIQEKYLGKKIPTKDQVQEQQLRNDFMSTLSEEEKALVAQKIEERKVKEAELGRQRVISETQQEAGKAKEDAQVEKAIVAEEEATTQAERQPPGTRAPLSTEEQIIDRDKTKVNNIVTPAIAQNKTAQEILSALAGKDYNRSFAYQTTAEYFSKFLNKIKGEVKIRFGTVADGRPGQFNPKTNTITIDKNNLGKAHVGQIVTHEMVHYAIDHLLDNRKGLTTEQQAGIKRIEALHNYVKSQIGTNEFDISELKEFIAEAFSNSQFQQRLAQIPRPPRSTYTVVRDLARAIVAALGLRSSNPAVLEEIIDQVDNILSGKDYLPPSKQVRGKVISYAPKQAGQPKSTYNRELRKSRIRPTAYNKPNAIQTVKNATIGEKARDTLVTKFQNVSYAIKKWQADFMKAGKITVGGKDFTNIYDYMATAPGQALFQFKDKLESKVNILRQEIAAYAKASNQSIEDALFDLHEYSEALHEPERRRIKFLKTVPLSTKKNIKIGNQMFSAVGLRDAIFERVSENVEISKAELQGLRAKLDSIVDAKNPNGKWKYRDTLGEGKYKSIDENSADYNVTAELNSADVAEIMSQYSPEKVALMNKVLDAVKPIQEATVALNKQGNYWSQTTDNIKNFYGWKHYVPLKGTGIKMPSNIDFLNLEDKRLSNELKDAPMAMEGRMSEAENPIERIMVDASISAARAGRVGLTQAVKNAVTQKLIDGKVAATYTPEEIYKGIDQKGQELMKQRSSIIHYNEDGTMDIIKISDPVLLESIRRTYQEGHPMIDLANRITSFIGQTHTRYNPAFPILNFVRDTLTNAFVMAVDVSPKEAFKYVTAVATSVVNGGLFKANRAMRAYNRGDIQAIRELAKKDSYYKDMLDFMEQGGLVSVLAGLSVKSQQAQLYKELNQNKVLATKEQIDKFFDGYVGTFEMAARIGAYRVIKSDMRAKGIPENVANERAAVYTKQLANFEEVGEWGKALGALFVFFRPSATGAARAFESIGPALRSWESVYRSLPDKIRNDPQALSTYEANWKKQSDTARATIICLIGAGMASYAAAAMLADDDDEGRNKIIEDDLSRWTRFARFDIGKNEAGQEQVLQIPWGFGLGGFMAAGAQIAGGLSSKTNTIGSIFSNVMNIGLDSFVPLPVSRINMVDHPAAFVVDSLMPSVARPFVEYTMNMNAFGQEIYNNRNSRYGDAYTGGDSIPELYKDVARGMVDNFGVDISPNVLYFFANNYFDGMTRLAQNSYGLEQTLTGQKDFDLKRDAIFLESFLSTKSNVDQREYSRMEEAVRKKERMLNMFKTNPEKYAEYIIEHPYDKMIVDMYNRQINGNLKRLREQANQYRRMPGLSPKERNALLQPNREMQNLTKRMVTYQINTMLDIED
jgi:hypothetical protein